MKEKTKHRIQGGIIGGIAGILLASFACCQGKSSSPRITLDAKINDSQITVFKGSKSKVSLKQGDRVYLSNLRVNGKPATSRVDIVGIGTSNDYERTITASKPGTFEVFAYLPRKVGELEIIAKPTSTVTPVPTLAPTFTPEPTATEYIPPTLAPLPTIDPAAQATYETHLRRVRELNIHRDATAASERMETIVARRAAIPTSTPTPFITMYDSQIPSTGKYVFVIDVSPSMRGQKIENAKVQLRNVISNLNENDLFSIVTFTCKPDAYNASLVNATEEGKGIALSAIELMVAQEEGESGTGPAVEYACRIGGRNSTIILVTDGKPNCPYDGVRRHEQTILNAASKNGCKINSFGVSPENSEFEDFLISISEKTGGTYYPTN